VQYHSKIFTGTELWTGDKTALGDATWVGYVASGKIHKILSDSVVTITPQALQFYPQIIMII